VSPAQLRKWNGLRKEQPLKPGRQLLVLVPAPAAPSAESTLVAAAAPPPVTVATLRHTAPTDSTLQLLAAANARYARQAQERAARELAQAQELARVKKQLAARAAAQKRLSIAQAAAAAKAAAATRLGLPADSTTTEDATVAATLAPAPVLEVRTAKRREGSRTTARQSEPSASLVASTDLDSTPEEATTSSRLSRTSNVAEGRVTGRALAETRRVKEEKTESATAIYTVRPGDNLTKLAQTQGVSIEQLKAWNKLTTETVMAGQQLRLAAPADATSLPVAVQHTAPRRAKNSLASAKLETHTVQPGDTLFSIAKRFGLTLTELKRLNHLATDQVKPGQKLVVGG
jgi:membrane-bound lytic murein transglycosylase D